MELMFLGTTSDPAALATLRERGLPDHETAVEIPAALLRFAEPTE